MPKPDPIAALLAMPGAANLLAEGRIAGLGDVAAPVKQVAARPAKPPTAIESRVRVEIELIGLVLRSEANTGGRLRERIGRKEAVKAAVRNALADVRIVPRFPVRVVLTKLGGKPWDDDNLANGFKACRDVAAEWLEVDDGDRSKVRFVYRQRAAYKQGIRITVG